MPPFKLARPLVFFDLETTGLMQEIDRVIELGLLKLFPDGRRQKLLQRFNPGIKIPAESSAVHGITNKDLEGQPKFFEKAKELFDLFADSDLGGYNIKRFDIPMLTKEFEIAGLNFSMEGRRIVDPSVIFRVREPRSLSAAYKFYVGKELTDAHSAEADNDATFEVFLAQMERYPDLPRDVEGLHALGNAPDPGWVDADGKLVWRDGEAFFSFGKYRGRALTEVCRHDPSYIDWLSQKNDFPSDFRDVLAKAKRGVFPKNTAASA